MCVACNHTIHRKNHNFGWSRDFAPALRCKPGETIHFECLDAGGGTSTRGSTVADVATLDFGRVNPVTGPVYVEGAEPGDALKMTFRKFMPSGFGWTANIPGFGLLADQFPEPALHLWNYDPATMAPALYGPKGRVPLKPFAGDRRRAGRAGPAFRRAAAPRRRQSRHPRPRRRHHALSAGRGRGRAVLGRRHPCGPGRRRGLRHRHREPDGRRADARSRQGRASCKARASPRRAR